MIFNRMFCIIASSASELCKISFSMLTFAFFAIDWKTFNFVRMNLASDVIDQLAVFEREHPYSDCGKSNSRFRCLNECFKNKHRLSKYFYDSNETGRIHLDLPKNLSIEESEKNCFGVCKRENCKLVKLISKPFLKGKPKTEIFVAQPMLNEIDFWIQLIGLLGSFSGLSFRDLIFIAIEFITSKLRRKKLESACFS